MLINGHTGSVISSETSKTREWCIE